MAHQGQCQRQGQRRCLCCNQLAKSDAHRRHRHQCLRQCQCKRSCICQSRCQECRWCQIQAASALRLQMSLEWKGFPWVASDRKTHGKPMLITFQVPKQSHVWVPNPSITPDQVPSWFLELYSSVKNLEPFTRVETHRSELLYTFFIRWYVRFTVSTVPRLTVPRFRLHGFTVEPWGFFASLVGPAATFSHETRFEYQKLSFFLWVLEVGVSQRVCA